MQNIAFYLDKYSSVGLKEVQYKKALTEAIQETIPVTLDSKKIKVDQNMIHIDVSGTIKSEIFINKNKINELFIKKLSALHISKPIKPII